MNRLLNDLRYGFRMLLKTPSATAMVLIALSLGIGLSAFTFSLIQGAVLPTLPVEGGDRIERADELSQTVEVDTKEATFITAIPRKYIVGYRTKMQTAFTAV